MLDAIPLNDLSRIHAPIRAEIERAIARVMDSSRFLRGTEVSAFEEEWAEFCGQKHCVACASGTDALTLAAQSMELSEASVQSNTLALTAIGLHRGGATVRIVDIDETGRVDPGARDSVPVLLFGRQPGETEARQRIFDAAHAHGWRPPSHAMACWSFYPTKTLGAMGDSGAITTNDATAAGKMRELSGLDDKLRDRHQITSRMDEIQAAILRTKLRYLPAWIEERREIAARYRTRLPPQASPVANSPNDLQHLFVVRVACRDELSAFLTTHGVETKIHFPQPLHLQQGPWTSPSRLLPMAAQWCNSILTLPCFPGLTPAETNRVCDLIARFFESAF